MIEINVLQFWLGVLVLLLGGIGTTIRAVYSIEGRFDTIVKEQDAKLNKAKDEGDEKRRRIYERFDEYKTHLESNFVRWDMGALELEQASGYANDVCGVASANIGKVNSVATADIAEVNQS